MYYTLGDVCRLAKINKSSLKYVVKKLNLQPIMTETIRDPRGHCTGLKYYFSKWQVNKILGINQTGVRRIV